MRLWRPLSVDGVVVRRRAGWRAGYIFGAVLSILGALLSVGERVFERVDVEYR